MKPHQAPPHIGIISQARMLSQRLPGKVLKKIEGKTLLEYHLQRLFHSDLSVVVATTTRVEDDLIVQELDRLKIDVFRSSEDDVLRRYFETAQAYKFDVIIRVTSDCPLIDGELICKGLNMYLQAPNPKRTYLSNCQKRTYPRGFDFEIFSMELLKEAYLKAKSALEREHVTPYFYREAKADISLINLEQSKDQSEYRITVDTPEDFELIRLLIEAGAHQMSFEQIITLLDEHPSWARLNQYVEQKPL